MNCTAAGTPAPVKVELLWSIQQGMSTRKHLDWGRGDAKIKEVSKDNIPPLAESPAPDGLEPVKNRKGKAVK